MSDFRVWHFFCYIVYVVPNAMSFRAEQSEAKNLDNTHVYASEILPPSVVWMTIISKKNDGNNLRV